MKEWPCENIVWDCNRWMWKTENAYHSANKEWIVCPKCGAKRPEEGKRLWKVFNDWGYKTSLGHEYYLPKDWKILSKAALDWFEKEVLPEKTDYRSDWNSGWDSCLERIKQCLQEERGRV